MNPAALPGVIRIGIFYDGGYFSEVSKYYRYHHERQARISINGLHEFVRARAADLEKRDTEYCRIVDAHYFRGRYSAEDSERKDMLLGERMFDDILIKSGVLAHYLPRGTYGEKGVDVLLALETYELAVHKQFDIVCLVACDGDYLPLVRKLHALGTRVMLLAWDFTYNEGEPARQHTTRTAETLLKEVTYPLLMNSIIDARTSRRDQTIEGLFIEPSAEALQRREERATNGGSLPAGPPLTPPSPGFRQGRINFLNPNGTGWITDETEAGKSWFFHHSVIMDASFFQLKVGQEVAFEAGISDKTGKYAAVKVRPATPQTGEEVNEDDSDGVGVGAPAPGTTPPAAAD
ncbi:MAG: NYN domain-containing protein [Candidatus Sumerlaeia bacterium]|nr:NYN domain-containing protein [Candidatus Sumerlaeia bacterium]